MRFDFVYTTFPPEHKFSHRVGIAAYRPTFDPDGTTGEEFLWRSDMFFLRPGTAQHLRWLTEQAVHRPETNTTTYYAIQTSTATPGTPANTDNRVRSMSNSPRSEAHVLQAVRDQLWFSGEAVRTLRVDLEVLLFNRGSSEWLFDEGNWQWERIEELLPGFLQVCDSSTHENMLNRQRCLFRFKEEGHPVCMAPDCEREGIQAFSVYDGEGERTEGWTCADHLDYLEYCNDCGWRFTPGNTRHGSEWIESFIDSAVDYSEEIPEDLDAQALARGLGWSSLQYLEGVRWCEPCADAQYERVEGDLLGIDCVGCGTLSFIAVNDDRNYCAECDRTHHRWSVMAYSHKPQPIFHPEMPDDPRLLYHGFEFEVAGMGHTAACRWAEREGLSPDLFYLKSDSSVSRGTEVVTHPFSLEWARESFPFAAFDAAVASYGAIPDDPSAGTHIHVSKASFSRAHMYKFLQLHFRLPTLLQTLGGRGDVGYARWTLDGVRAVAKQVAMKQNAPLSRLAVNVNPAHTVELRYPASGFSATLARKNIELPNALYQFSAEISIQNIKDGVIDKPGTFVWWLQQEREQFPTLTTYMEENILMPTAYERSI